MTLFIALALTLMVLALWPLVSTVWRASSKPDQQPASQVNLALLREQRARLETELADGTLSQDEYTQAQNELARRVLQESAPVERNRQTSRRTATAAALLLVVPVLAIGLYAYLGEPDAVRYGKSVV